MAEVQVIRFPRRRMIHQAICEHWWMIHSGRVQCCRCSVLPDELSDPVKIMSSKPILIPGPPGGCD